MPKVKRRLRYKNWVLYVLLLCLGLGGIVYGSGVSRFLNGGFCRIGLRRGHLQALLGGGLQKNFRE